MSREDEFRFSFDAATAINQGARDYQEDAVITDFANGSSLGFVVLADGMGGHAAGDIASRIVVAEMFGQLTLLLREEKKFQTHARYLLLKATESANECLRHHAETNPKRSGMGSTLVATVVLDGALYWVSVGDSPLYLFRDNALIRLNENHSMSESIDLMVQAGTLSEEEARNHPDRSVLTSALAGGPISKIDCPNEPMAMRPGDILIVASDGLQFLDDKEIKRVLRDRSHCRSSEIADILMKSLVDLNDPDLDNVSFSVVQFKPAQDDIIPLATPDWGARSKPSKPPVLQTLAKHFGRGTTDRDSGFPAE